MTEQGHIELERSIDAIIIGVRHRKDPGDIEALMRSIEGVGLLQPITITPDGVLVCGWRRLEAVRRLGWRTLKVWVRSGISDRLSELLAQQDENAQRKPLSPLEMTELWRELKQLHAEDASRRQTATRFGSDGTPGGENGAGDSPAPDRGRNQSRAQAAEAITGDQSYQRFERISWLERVAASNQYSPAVRQLAETVLKEIDEGAPVMPGYSRVKAAIEVAATSISSAEDLEALAAESLARVNQSKARRGLRAVGRNQTTAPKHRTLRAFILTWAELDGWSRHFDPAEIAAGLKDEEWQRFERVLAETTAFAERLRLARDELAAV